MWTTSTGETKGGKRVKGTGTENEGGGQRRERQGQSFSTHVKLTSNKFTSQSNFHSHLSGRTNLQGAAGGHCGSQ